MKKIKGHLTTPQGFFASGLACGIKAEDQLDLSLLHSYRPAQAAAVMTKNSIKAAPLQVTAEHLKRGLCQTVIVNSGNANCFTGETGLLDARNMVQAVADHMDVSLKHVAVASTGIIGVPLPIKKIFKAMPKLTETLSNQGGKAFADAILTTDTVSKQTVYQIVLNETKVTVAGCAKGAGMIAPNMATMLGFITTDAMIPAKFLKPMLRRVVDKTFNSISIDGCMSTNDMVIVLANGASEIDVSKKSKWLNDFEAILTFVCQDLSRKIIADAEGGTKVITVAVRSAKTAKEARQVAETVANSVLVKTAAFGQSSNWGRIAAAVGSLGIKDITESSLKIDCGSFKSKNIKINIELHRGQSEHTMLTSDLSLDYVKINADYN